MLNWTDVTLAYAGYLVALAWLVPRFSQARPAATAALAVSLVLWWAWAPGSGPVAAALTWVVIPSLALLGTYRVSGTFFVRPSPALERWLLAGDDWLLGRTGLLGAYGAAPLVVSECFELLYLLVYVVVPAGATVLLIGEASEALGAYWTTLFLAEVTCYAALPWLQSRPPRTLEPEPVTATAGPLRGLNLWFLRHGSIQVNTLPSAHAAGAIAAALSVHSAMPAAGVVFLLVGAGITLATVLGRYHYAVDSMLGLAVAGASWTVMRA